MHPSADTRDHTTSQRRGGTTQVVLITLVVIFLLFFLACAGLGVAGYFWFQRFLGEAMVTDAAGIRKITSDMTDVTMPEEFSPYTASRIFGIVHATWRWCPSKDCSTIAADLNLDDPDESTNLQPMSDEEAGLGHLTFSSTSTDGLIDEDEQPDPVSNQGITDEVLKYRFVTYEQEVITRDIRGETCKFHIVTGDERLHEIDWDEIDGENVEQLPEAKVVVAEASPTEPAPAESAVVSEQLNGPADAAAAADAAKAANGEAIITKPKDQDAGPKTRKVVFVSGTFPGKQAPVKMEFLVSPEQYDEAIIRQLIDSIR